MKKQFSVESVPPLSSCRTEKLAQKMTKAKENIWNEKK
jgi:hypothetical protein